jgi:uncharacterized protein (TIGR03437 family)
VTYTVDASLDVQQAVSFNAASGDTTLAYHYGIACLPPAAPAPPAATQAPVIATTTNAASFTGSTLAPDSAATICGTNLALATLVAPAGGSTNLGGAQVTVSGIQAQLLYVSPTQINFVVPGSALAGPAIVEVQTVAGTAGSAVTIATTAPGLFSSGQGVASATLVSTDSSGNTTSQPVTAQPIALSSGSTYTLALFATGVRHASNLPVVTVGGQQVSVLSSGAADSSTAGLDEIKVALPASLPSGTLQIVATVDGQTSNTVTMTMSPTPLAPTSPSPSPSPRRTRTTR